MAWRAQLQPAGIARVEHQFRSLSAKLTFEVYTRCRDVPEVPSLDRHLVRHLLKSDLRQFNFSLQIHVPSFNIYTIQLAKSKINHRSRKTQQDPTYRLVIAVATVWLFSISPYHLHLALHPDARNLHTCTLDGTSSGTQKTAFLNVDELLVAISGYPSDRRMQLLHSVLFEPSSRSSS